MKYTVLSTLALIFLNYHAEAAQVHDQLPQGTPSLGRDPSVWDGPSSDWLEAPYRSDESNTADNNDNVHDNTVNESYFDNDAIYGHVERLPSYQNFRRLPSERPKIQRAGDSLMTVDLNSDDEDILPPPTPLTRETLSSRNAEY